MVRPPSRPRLQLVGPDAEVRYYLRRARDRAGGVLVLGAADGRLPIELAEIGRTVVAVEPSPLLRAQAEARLASAGEPVVGRVRLVGDDPRTLQLGARFGLVFAPHNALGLAGSLVELEAMLAAVRAHLEPGGVFAFDLLHPVELEHEDGEPHAALAPQRPGFAPHLRERRAPGEKRAQGLQRLKAHPFRVIEVDRALAGAGLMALERYGDFRATPFAPDSARQVVVAAESGC